MGIHIDILGLSDDNVYTSNDLVQGIVAIKAGKGTRISDITIALKGTVKSSVIEAGPAFIMGNDVPKVAQEEHEFVRMSQRLFPYTNTLPGHDQPVHATNRHTIPFKLCFPAVQMLPGASQKPLPPSFQTRSSEKAAAAEIVYSLEVVVKRHKRLRTDTTTEKVLTLIPSYPSAVVRALHPSTHSAQTLYATNTLSTTNIDNLPTLTVEARLPSSILQTGHKIPLRLYVRMLPRRTNQVSSVVLKTLNIRLRALTSIRAVGQKRSWSSTLSLLDLEGIDEVFACSSGTESLSEVHNRSLQHLMLSSSNPSFSTTTVEQRHVIEVEAVFSIPELKV
ncbi:hypothetical protein BDW69DRAFT_184962 [Aspergillus filifer]